MNSASLSKRSPRLFILAVWTLLLLPAASANGQDEIPINMKRLSDRILVTWACDYFQGTNMAVLITSEGLVLIDTGLSPTTVRRQREAIEQELGRSDFKYIINTHFHNDHAFANEVFPEATVVGPECGVAALREEVERIPELIERLRSSFEDYREWAEATSPDSGEGIMAREGVAAFNVGIGDLEKGIEPRYPTLTFKDHLSLDVGDLRIELYQFPGFHSTADILILVPEERILFTGDTLMGNHLPWLRENSADGFPHLLNTWKAILDACPELDTVVTGHSDLPLSAPQFRAMYTYLSKLWSDIRAAREEGTTLERVLLGSPLRERYPEVADMNYTYQDLNFHQHNIYILWQLAGR